MVRDKGQAPGTPSCPVGEHVGGENLRRLSPGSARGRAQAGRAGQGRVSTRTHAGFEMCAMCAVAARLPGTPLGPLPATVSPPQGRTELGAGRAGWPQEDGRVKRPWILCSPVPGGPGQVFRGWGQATASLPWGTLSQGNEGGWLGRDERRALS